MATPDISHLPSTRKEAIAKGLSYYFTGKPCKHGHISKRFTVCGKCYKCHEEKMKTDHYKQKTKERLARNADKIRERAKLYRRKWRAENRELSRQIDRNYKQKNKERITENRRKAYWKNPEKYRAYAIKSSKKEGAKEKKKIYFSEWSKKNRDLLKVKEDKRRALEYNAEGSHTAQEVKSLLEVQNYKCLNCKCCIKERSSRHLDHIMPLALGGSNYITNLQWLCKSCNMSKNAKHPIDWAQQNGRLL